MTKIANKLRVAFMGHHGSQTFLACLQLYPDAELVSYPSFQDIAEAVGNRKVDFGMLAVESIAAGRVDQVHNILANMDIVIIGEHFHPVSHALMGVEASNLEGIKTAISHPQALMQCSKLIADQGWETQYAANSASAALQVSQSNDTSRAAICAEIAGARLGLKKLADNIQDNLANATLFAIVAHKGQNFTPAPSTSMMTTLLVTLTNQTASLHNALGCFANNGVDVIKLESYIPGGPSRTAKILLSVKGSPKNASLRAALDELQLQSFKYKSLGTYPSAPERDMEFEEFTTYLIANGQ